MFDVFPHLFTRADPINFAVFRQAACLVPNQHNNTNVAKPSAAQPLEFASSREPKGFTPDKSRMAKKSAEAETRDDLKECC